MKINSAFSVAYIAACMLLAGFAVSGCSSAPPKPNDALVRAKSAVDQATTADGQRYAAVDLNNARSKLLDANEAQSKGDYQQARYLAQESEVDAQLAMAKTQAAKAQAAAQEVRQGNQTLQNQLNRQGSPSMPPAPVTSGLPSPAAPYNPPPPPPPGLRNPPPPTLPATSGPLPPTMPRNQAPPPVPPAVTNVPPSLAQLS